MGIYKTVNNIELLQKMITEIETNLNELTLDRPDMREVYEFSETLKKLEEKYHTRMYVELNDKGKGLKR